MYQEPSQSESHGPRGLLRNGLGYPKLWKQPLCTPAAPHPPLPISPGQPSEQEERIQGTRSSLGQRALDKGLEGGLALA